MVNPGAKRFYKTVDVRDERARLRDPPRRQADQNPSGSRLHRADARAWRSDCRRMARAGRMHRARHDAADEVAQHRDRPRRASPRSDHRRSRQIRRDRFALLSRRRSGRPRAPPGAPPGTDGSPGPPSATARASGRDRHDARRAARRRARRACASRSPRTTTTASSRFTPASRSPARLSSDSHSPRRR